MNKYIFRTLVSLLLVAGMGAFIWKADPVKPLLQRIEQQLQTYRVNLNPEKLYVHLDRDQYVAGETVWMKAYLVHASDQKPLTLDEVVYVDLLNAAGEAVMQHKYKAQHGVFAGQIVLPDTLEADRYQIVAYTNWMRNFEDQPFFRKNIQIWTKDSQPQLVNNAESTEVADLQFFPEGGDWMFDVPSQVAFKAINEAGLGVPVNGKITNDSGEKVADFKSLHQGMGAILLTPKQGENHTAVINLPNGETKQFDLPQPRTQGYTLATEEYVNPESLKLNVYARNVKQEPLLLTVIAGDQIIHSQEITDLQGHRQWVLDKSKLPTGINRLTLATAEGRLLAERLVFMHPDRQLQVKISTDKPEYLKKEKVELTVETSDGQGNPVSANLSMAVTDAELVPEDSEQQGIYAQMLLSSELKGHVEQPNYYFKDVTPEKKEVLQLVMMTHGWRRFGWQEMLDAEKPAFRYAKENAISLDGRLLKDNGDPVKNGEVILYVKDQHETFVVQQTDEEGYFSFEGFDFQDSVEVVIQGTTARGNRNVKVVMDEHPFTPAFRDIPTSLPADQLLASNEKFITRSANQSAVADAYQPGLKEMLLKEIIVQERRENIVGPFRLHQRADAVIDVDQLPVAPSGNVLESLQGRIPGVQINRLNRFDFQAVIRGSGTPLYLLDGMPVDASVLNAISQFDLDRIEVIKGPSAAIYGGRGGGGVIALFTKRGGMQYEEVEPNDNIIIYRAGGFQQYREFYVPRYTAEGQTDRPDYRTTLHWEPMIQTDSSGRATVNFFTANRATDYRVVVNGISDAGLTGYTRGSVKFVKSEKVSP
jgi:hypothetical protein